jgi:hypothetical protein
MASYDVELYNSQNATQTFVADITPLVQDLEYIVPLNNFEELTFSMDLWGWKAYCAKIGIDPYLSIQPLTAEIKLKRDGVYLPMAFEIKTAPKRYTADNATISIQARGTLSKLGDALITKNYLQSDGTYLDATAIVRDLIATRQAKPYGDFGITNGNTYLTGVLTERQYTRYSVMDAIRNLSDDASGGFDFYFDHDWSFYTMAQRGSLKNDITYRFGDQESNVLDYENPEDGSDVANSITIVGEGIGNPLLSDPAAGLDVESALTYGLRERALIFSDIKNQTWLDDRAVVEKLDRKDLYDLPTIVVSGEVFNLNEKWTGDTIPLACTDTASPYMGNGRIKKLTVSVDDNHHEIIRVECLRV